MHILQTPKDGPTEPPAPQIVPSEKEGQELHQEGPCTGEEEREIREYSRENGSVVAKSALIVKAHGFVEIERVGGADFIGYEVGEWGGGRDW